jgi:hypothetical protein
MAKKLDISAASVRAILDYDPATGVFKWKRRQGLSVQWNGKWAGKVAGSPSSTGHIHIKIEGRGYCAHRLAWLYMTGDLPNEIDHINADKTDNRFNNLRIATRAQNNANKGVQKNSASRVKGVYKFRNKFKAQMWLDNKPVHLGVFDTLEEAKSAHEKAYKELYGEYARIE